MKGDISMSGPDVRCPDHAALDAERTLWKGVVEGIADELWVCDVNGRMSLMNLHAVTSMGLEAFEGKSVMEVLEEVDILYPDGTPRPPEEAPLLRSLKGEIVRGEEIMRHRKTGLERHRQFSSSPTRDASGAITGAVAIVRDITEMIHAEEALLDSEGRFRALVKASSEVVYHMNADWSEMRQLSGGGFIVETEAPIRDWLQKYILPEDQQHVVAVINQAIQAKGIFELEHPVRRRDGSLGWTRSRAIPILDPKGEIIEWFGIASDITERKQAEETLNKLNEDISARNRELLRLNKELETFAYSVSHDLRAPLRIMEAFAKAMLEDYAEKLDEAGRNYLVRIRHSADQMSLLIEDLLELSRISRQELSKMNYDLSYLASSIIWGLQEGDPMRNSEIVIAEGMRADVDPNLMRIALTNLLANAWKFTSKTEKTRIEFGAMKQEGKTVFFVMDNGAGFDPVNAEKMFMPFQRLHSASEFEGTGIGLAIVDRIIRRHGGTIWAEGEVGKGAVFYFSLE